MNRYEISARSNSQHKERYVQLLVARSLAIPMLRRPLTPVLDHSLYAQNARQFFEAITDNQVHRATRLSGCPLQDRN
jgi:hypothetical protein